MRGYEDSKIPRLFELIEERKISQTDLSKATGIAKGSITDWKRGKSVPSGQSLLALSEYFGVTAEYLLGSEAPECNEIDQKIHSDLTKLSDEQKKEVLNYIKFVLQKTTSTF